MSEALADEVEVINSIYGDGSLTQSTDAEASQDNEESIYILQLPEESSTSTSLRLLFPAAYPDVPPAILGTHSSAGGVRGAAAHDLALFRAAVAAVYEPGQVCLFDAVERFKELVEESAAAAAAVAGSSEEEGPPEPSPTLSPSIPDNTPPPPWITSDPVIELKSVFLARCAPVTSPAQARSYVQHLLTTDKKVRSATHNMTAWRIRGTAGKTGTVAYQDCDDDGETAAGGRLLHLMQLMDLWDVMVIVTRWYGGQKLGPRRFALINSAARDAFVKAGLVGDSSTAATGTGSGTPGGNGGKKKGHGR
jgi:hypothetical protein